MVIKKASKKKHLKGKILLNNEEIKAEKFINIGGEVPKEEAQVHLSVESKFTIRVPKNLISQIDSILKKEIGRMSRNTWIVQAISEKLNLSRN